MHGLTTQKPVSLITGFFYDYTMLTVPVLTNPQYNKAYPLD